MFNFTKFVLFVFILFFGTAGKVIAQTPQAENWQPEKPVTIIVPSNPGGGWDQTARFVQQTIIENDFLPVAIEVVNRGGGGGTIALAELVETYDGDRHKLMITGFGMIGSALMHESDYSLSDITPIARLTGEYQVIAVSEDSPFQTLESLVEAFVKNPKSISWAGGSAGGADQIFIVQVAEALGISADQVNYVAFTGGGEANAAVMGNQVSAAINGYAEIKGLAESGRVKILAVSSETRIVHPDVPTFKEKGIDVTFQNWRGLVAPPDIGEAQQAYYTDLIAQVQSSDLWQEILKRNEWQDSFLTDPELGKFFEEDKQKTAKTLVNMGVGKSNENSAIGPHFFPRIVGLGLLLCGGILAVQYFRARKLAFNDNVVAKDPDEQKWSAFAMTLGLVILYVIGLELLGFIWVTPFFIVALANIIGSKSLIRDIITAIILTGVVVLIFDHLLNVSLP